MPQDITGRDINVGDKVIATCGTYSGLYVCEVMKVHPKLVSLSVLPLPNGRKPDYHVERHMVGYRWYTPYRRSGNDVYIVETKTVSDLTEEHTQARIDNEREAAWQLGYDVGYQAGVDIANARNG